MRGIGTRMGNCANASPVGRAYCALILWEDALVNAKDVALVVGSVVVLAGFTACNRGVPSTAATAAETVTPVSRTYVVESNELIEVSRFEDGSVKYTPSGFLVISTTSAAATATALSERR